MAGILVYCEKDSIAWELLDKAAVLKPALGGLVSIALFGPDAGQKAAAAFSYGADAVYIAGDAGLAGLASDLVAAALEQVVRQTGAGAILIGSTLRGKSLAPRLAQKLSAGCVTDAIGLDVEDGQLVARRYAYGGKTVAAEALVTRRQVVAMIPRHTTPQAGKARQARQGQVVTVSLELPPSRLRLIERQPKAAGATEIESAERLIGVGRGLKRKEDLSLIEEFARRIGAAVGCSRTLAYDYRWLPEAQLIGLSGKKCSPRVYIGIGVSGQIQHMMGVSGARLIVAINTDKDAPIFQSADYGVVGDLYQIIPRLMAHL